MAEDDTLKLTDKQWTDAFLHFRHKLRAGRAAVQADAEDYVAVWEVVESLVEYLKANCKDVPVNRHGLDVILNCLFSGSTADSALLLQLETAQGARNAVICWSSESGGVAG